ncbi:sushi, von Willebrand factor type A, EGF and pentraxin domain-containing protein 1-like [Lytechinus pictus]|uniref:sushi, von Willebrand factor type A, EGF and pentraxin domain-containing protein 1-like n=1 Tax=Lytechinus pictus TaxID=7653 RepID=UPI0030B9E57A
MIKITCSIPESLPSNLNTNDTDCEGGNSITINQQCSYYCDDGHNLAGSDTVTCQEDSTLSGELPTCEEVTCSIPESLPSNLNTNDTDCEGGDSITINQQCTYYCDDGHNLAGSDTVTCQEDSTLSGELPTCEEITCSIPESLPSNLNTNDTDCEGGDSITINQQCTYYCDDGHNLAGSDTVTCQEDSTLSGDLPTCEEVTCSIPESLPSNLNTNDTDCEGGDSITINQQCTYYCDDGHNLAGSDTVTCQEDSTLSGDLPTCEEVTCSIPESLPSNLNTNDTDCEGGDSITINQQCTYYCDDGHNLAGSDTVTCQEDSTLSGDLPTCEEITCSIPESLPSNLNTNDTDCEGGDSITINQQCTYYCDDGHNLAGSDTVTCQEDSTLSGDLPTCEEITCSIPESLPSNLNTDDTDCEGGDSIAINQQCSYYCDDGHNLAGSDTVTCQEDSTLSGELPTCEEVTCSIPESLPSNLNTNDTDCEGGDSINIDQQCTYYCDDGHNLAGSDTVTCQEDSTLSGELPTCEEITCSIPESLPSNLNTNDTDCEGGDSINIDQQCTYYCDDGHNLAGSDTVTCQEDSTLSDELPTCEEITCSIPESLPSNLNTDDTDCEGGDSIAINQQCSYYCDDGHNLAGSDTVTCQEDSTLSGELPRCEEITCSIPESLPSNLNTDDTDCEGGDSINIDQQCTYYCDDGHNLAGSDTVTCQEDSTLSDELPTCEEITCSIPESLPSNLNTNDTDCEGGDSINIDQQCTYYCDDGHNLAGSDTVTCQEDSTLSGKLPTCEEITCSIPESLPSNLNTNDTDCEGGDSINIDQQCTYYCDDGHNLAGSDTVTCQEDSTLSGELPTCEEITCSIPESLPSNLNTDDTDCEGGDSINIDQQCTYYCDDGHNLAGSDTVTCQEDSTLSGELPTCEEITCSIPESLPSNLNTDDTDCEGGDSIAINQQCSYYCDDGHNLAGSDTVTCQEDSTLSGELPTCEEITCSIPESLPSNLNTNDTDCEGGDSITINQQCTYYCDDGHNLAGSDTVTCQEDSTLSGELPTCEEVTCSIPESLPSNLNTNDTDCEGGDSITINQQCTYYCDDGHNLAGSDTVTCQEDSTLSGELPTCEEITCSIPESLPSNLNTDDTDCEGGDSITINQQCSYYCDDGHNLAGSDTVTCQEDSTLSGELPTCEEITCSIPESLPSNLNTDDTDCEGGDSIAINQQCSYYCDDGHNLAGSDTVTCQEDSTLSGELPTCEEITCSIPESLPSNLNTDDTDCEGGDSIAINQQCSYYCDDGHNLAGSDTVTCQEDSTLSGELPTCEEITCSIPESLPSNLNTDDTDCEGGDSIAINQQCSYYCDDGHNLAGSDTVTCQEDSTLSGELPTCEEITCSIPESLPSNLNTDDTDCEGGDSIAINQQCSYYCDDGHNLAGSDTVTCQEDSTLSGELPTCEEITCSIPESLPSNLNTDDTDCEGGDSITINQQCTYYCDDGHNLAGSDTVTCQEDSTLSGELPTCEEITCSIPESLPSNLNTDDTDCEGGDSIAINQQCSYYCDDGHNLAGSDTVTCQEDSTLSGELPTCEAMKAAASLSLSP